MTSIPTSGRRVFTIVWMGQLVSTVGASLTGFALAIWVLEKTGGATPFATVVLLNMLPQLLLAPFAGSIADWFDRRELMILADMGTAAVTAVTLLIWMAGALNIWFVFILVVLGSIFVAMQEPAYIASIPTLVPERELPRANGLVEMAKALQQVVPPVVAGALYAASGLGLILVIDLCTYAVGILALLLVQFPRVERNKEHGGRPAVGMLSLREGLRHIRSRPGLMRLLYYFAVLNFCVNFAIVLVGPLVLSFSSPRTFGAIQSTMGLAALGGSIAVSTRASVRRYIPLIIGLVATAGVGLIVTSLRPNTLTIGAGLFILMFCAPGIASLIQSLFQSKISREYQGRVFAARVVITRSLLPVAYIFAGVLADHVFDPWFRVGGPLDGTVLESVVGTGPGRGVAALFFLSGAILVLASVAASASRTLHMVDELLAPSSDAPEDSSAGVNES